MGAQPTFQQILEEKLSSSEGEIPKNDGPETVSQRENTVATEAFETFMASLFRRNVNFKFTVSPEHVRRSYPTPPCREKPLKPRPTERTVLVKDLNPVEKKAFDTLAELGAQELNSIELLSESMVKKVFRRLALKLHPDKNPNGGTHDFRRARAAHDVLLKTVKN